MRLSYAFLAHSAEFTAPDGKLYVIGGDFDTIYASGFPAVQPSTTLVAKLVVQPLECGRPHRLRIEFIESDGNPVQPALNLEFTPNRNEAFPHRAVGVGIALNMPGLSFPSPGSYGFHILVDDLELGTVSLYVEARSQSTQGST